MKNDKRKKEYLNKDEQFILDVLRYLGAKGDDTIVTMVFLLRDKENRVKNAGKLKKYIEFKGEYVTQQNIFAKAFQITTPREQYYPCEMYVKYVGDTTDQLVTGKIYHVEMVFGDDEVFLIEYDKGAFGEFDSELFENQKVVEVVYTGSEKEDGTKRLSDGFEEGKVYRVLSFKMGEYTCDNNFKCMLDEVEPCGFEKREQEQPIPFKSIDDALQMVIGALEFGRVHALSVHLHPECEYISQTGEKEFHTKKEIVKYLQKVSNEQLENDIFLDCALATVTETEKTSKFSKGERCVAIYEEEGCKTVAFVILSDDNRYIKGIYVLNELYKFNLDE